MKLPVDCKAIDTFFYFLKSSFSSGPPIAGQIVSAVKEGCRQAFLKQPCRLMIAMYKCEIQVLNILTC